MGTSRAEHADNADNATIPVITENATESATDTSITAMNTVSKEVEIIDKNADEAIVVPAVVQNITETAAAATTETQPAETVTAATAVTETTPVNNVTADQFKMVAIKNSTQMHQAERLQKNQARIKAYKLEQKQHLAEIFTRIKALESKQLERYKANQDGRIVRLRKQISEQHQMIETLVLRNKELFELRAANIQRNQDNREQTLNRI